MLGFEDMKIDVSKIVGYDPWLAPYQNALKERVGRFLGKMKEIEECVGSLEQMAKGYEFFGLNPGKKDGENGVWYREWAPGALSLFLTGEFNDWSRFRHPMKKDDYGVWSIFLSDKDKFRLKHGSKVKVHVATKKGELDRIPAFIKRVVPDVGGFTGVYWQPKVFRWKNKIPKKPKNLRIYETHIGIAQEEGKIGSFEEFRVNVLPRIRALGYNAIQLMAIKQHPYYASFGYQVSNFFAVSHYFGEPDELKKLIDEAHGMGIQVLLDLVHSHSVKNVDEGLNEFDGTEYQYFRSGPVGEHPTWDTKIFDYGKFEVLRFLLSNIDYWMSEFRFDGFRFDGVTSMLYWDRGLGKAFDHYDRYFDPTEVDFEAVTYLMLANKLIKEINPEAISIAEDVSGMPGMALPIEEGGLGFDYRLAMGIPDFWIRKLKHVKDEDWGMRNIYDALTNRRYKEKHVAYAESHDQALVGDKTIAFWLMDKHMYDNMHVDHQNPVIDRGVALHKLIRLVTFALGGEAWLNFMGNEFGHPEWIDFPREGNNHSFHYARRQWSLVDNKELKYQFLNNFDKAMHKLDQERGLLMSMNADLLMVNEEKKLLVFERNRLIFGFNFHQSNSYENLQIPVKETLKHRLILDTDKKMFGGFGRIKPKQVFEPFDHRVSVYLPSRTAMVFKPDHE